MLNETEIIRFLAKQFPESIGDDAAVVALSENESYVITNDLLVEDIHFRLKYQNPKTLAHKSLHVNLSDIAAMGAVPKLILLGISIPNTYEQEAKAFFKNFAMACKQQDLTLIGGDTTRSSNQLFISITAIGVVATKNIKYRHSALIGNVICLAGDLGKAHIGLTALERNEKKFDEFKKSFLMPNARLIEGVWLGKKTSVSSMMDVSDGLFIDLKRLCDASNVAAEINLNTLPDVESLQWACDFFQFDTNIIQLVGGEDYGLLMTVHANAYPELAKKFMKRFGYPLHVLGRVTEGEGVNFIQNGRPKLLDLKPFSHFGETL